VAEVLSGWPDRVRYNQIPGHPMSLKLGTISTADKCCCLCRFYVGVLKIMILGQQFVIFQWPLN